MNPHSPEKETPDTIMEKAIAARMDLPFSYGRVRKAVGLGDADAPDAPRAAPCSMPPTRRRSRWVAVVVPAATVVLLTVTVGLMLIARRDPPPPPPVTDTDQGTTFETGDLETPPESPPVTAPDSLTLQWRGNTYEYAGCTVPADAIDQPHPGEHTMRDGPILCAVKDLDPDQYMALWENDRYYLFKTADALVPEGFTDGTTAGPQAPET